MIVTLLLGQSAVGANKANFTGEETSTQRAAARWITDTLPASSKIIMDSFAWVDLRDAQFTNGQPFNNAHYYWPIERDQSLQDIVLDGKWNNIDYIAFSPSTQSDVTTGTLSGGITDQGVRHSDVVHTFQSLAGLSGSCAFANSTNTRRPTIRCWSRTWETYKAQFIDTGRVITSPTSLRSTSEGQSYGLQRAVYMNDRAAFAQIWDWTHANLQRDDALFSWRWGKRDDGTRGIIDSNSAADADQDIALALLFAAKRWKMPAYEDAAREIIGGIWDHETVTVAGRRVPVAGELGARRQEHGTKPPNREPVILSRPTPTGSSPKPIRAANG